jgi:4-hydroxy-3-polyprenylbenzoate decarboxylase
MVICPCSMGTLGRVAAGNSGNLLERCADVILKERRNLVVVPRETPLNEIHLENMLRLARMGVRVVPPMPAFYTRPQSIDDLVSFVVGKVLDSLGMEHALYRPWGEGK